MQDILARIRAKKADEGFTLIELLVVVVIIGVLVAIAIPVYLNYRQGAADKSAQSDVRGAIGAVEQYYTTNNNTYPVTAASQAATFNLGGTGPSVTLSDKTTLSYILSGSTYLICATNAEGSGKVYLYSSSTGGSVKAASVVIATCT